MSFLYNVILKADVPEKSSRIIVDVEVFNPARIVILIAADLVRNLEAVANEALESISFARSGAVGTIRFRAIKLNIDVLALVITVDGIHKLIWTVSVEFEEVCTGEG